MKGFIIAGTKSGIGKTTISMALMRAFENVSPFKIGPDYIDGRFHEVATKNKSYNLDFILMGKTGIKYSLIKNSKSISIIEGVMGLYDGLGSDLDNGSTAHISRLLNLPVVLIVDGEKRSTSIAAEVLGYKLMDRGVNIIGVILNNIASPKSYEMLKEAIEKHADLPCFGYVEKQGSLILKERHLGLVEAAEVENLDKIIEDIAESIKKTVDLESIYEKSDINIEIDEVSQNLLEKEILVDEKERELEKFIFRDKLDTKKYEGLKIGIAKDSAFSFYYNDNLEFLEKLGIKLEYFSPIRDKKLPDDIDMLIFGGGYPELHSEKLERNVSLKEDIRHFYNKGGVIYGECGGYIYLSSGLKNEDDRKNLFVGLTPNLFCMKPRLNIKRFGYINVNYILENEKSKEEFNFPAHEFHYSDLVERSDESVKSKEVDIYKISKKDGRSWECGYSSKNLLCGYPHIHFYTSQDLIFNLLDRAIDFKEKRNKLSFSIIVDKMKEYREKGSKINLKNIFK